MELLNSIKSRTDRTWTPSLSRKTTSQIYWNLQKDQRRISPDFNRIHESHLAKIFELYDTYFFENELSQLLRELNHPLRFRLSGKMTRAGGKTTREETWDGRKLLTRKYEIAISTTLLFQTFQNGQQKANVTGVVCTDRLQALQRIMEHEIIHLVEMMVWYHSDCFRRRFQVITHRLFRHTESTHQLTTVDERAMKEFGVKVGDTVSFRHEGQLYQGLVNRITKRATVLVPSPQGELFSNGKRYLKFYVPIQNLSRTRKTA